MKTSIRSLLALSAVAFVLAACASVAPTSPSADPSATPAPTVAPSDAPSEAPAETPDAAPEVVGTITVVGAAVDGPGGTLDWAMTQDLSQPVFIRGFVFKDTDGQVYLADSMTDGPRVLVQGHPTDGPTWDIERAELTGLQETDGVLFYESSAIYGTLEL